MKYANMHGNLRGRFIGNNVIHFKNESLRGVCKMKMWKKVLIGGLVVAVAFFSLAWWDASVRKSEWPFYDDAQCKVTYSVCGKQLFEQGKADLEKVRDYFYQTYGIERSHVGMLGSSGMTQGLEKLQLGTYRVEVKPGYSFVFTSVASNTEAHLEGFGYVHMNRLYETIGLMAGLFYEMKHGNAYADIKQVLDDEKLQYFQHNYRFNRSIWLMYDKDEFSIGNTEWKHVWEAPEFELAEMMKEYLANDLMDIDDVLEKIAEIEWTPRLMLLPYTDDFERLERENKSQGAVAPNFEEARLWAKKVVNEVKGNYPGIEFDIEIRERQGETEVKGWGRNEEREKNQ